MKKKLSTLTLICCLAITPVFAEEEFNETKFLKKIKKEKTENLNQNSIDTIRNLLFKSQWVDYDGYKTIEKANLIVDTSKKVCGKDTLCLGYAYNDLIDASIYINIPTKTFELIDIAEKICTKNTENESLHKNIQRNYEAFYSHFGQPSKSLEYVVFKTNKQDREMHQLRYISEQDNAKRTLKLVEELEKKALKTNDESLLAVAYSYYIPLYYSIDNFPKMFEVINKAEKLSNNYQELKHTIIIAQISYYKDLSQYDKAKEIIAKELQDNTNSTMIERICYSFDIEKESKNIDKAIYYINDLNKFFQKRYPEKSSLWTKYTYEKFIDAYKEMDDYKNAEKYLEKYKASVEESKDITPIYYAGYLFKLGNYQNYKQNFEIAKVAQKEAISLYEKYEPTAHKLAELYKDLAEAELYSNNPEEALKNIKKAYNHTIKYYGATERDLKDIYIIQSKAYGKLGKTKLEEKYLDKAINVYSTLFGENNVKTLQEKLEKVNFYNKTQQKDKANTLLSQINKIVAENKYEGYSSELLFKIATKNAWDSMKKGNYEQALNDINLIKGIKYYRNHEKNEINNIKYHIYQNTGKKVKAYKYRKYANINN